MCDAVIEYHRIAIHRTGSEDRDARQLTGDADADSGANLMLGGVEDADVEFVV